MRKPGAGAAKGEGGVGSTHYCSKLNPIPIKSNGVQNSPTLGLPHRGSLLRAKSLHFWVCVGGPPKNHWGGYTGYTSL